MANSLFNSTIRQNPNDIIYPTIGMGNFLNNWQNNPELVKKINNSPQNIGYSNEEITNYMGQGLNFGVPEIAEAQRQWGIRTPKTEDELYKANEGIFNIYPTNQNKNVSKDMYLADPTAKNPDANTFINRMKNRIQTAPTRFQEALLGKPVEVLQPEGNVIDENGNIILQTGVGAAPRQGGIIKDFMTGARENYNQGFDTGNWGEKKNWTTRIGEGLGTLARWADTSLGRGLIAGGLIGALGGNPTEMTAYGLSAGVGRQQKRMQDQLYRNQLEEQGIDTSNISGMVDKDTFNSIGNMQNRALNTALKQQATESMNRLRELKIKAQEIINSTLPEMEKAKLLKANAEAQHAEDLIMAKIKAYENSAMLGLLNYGLRVNADTRAEAKEQRQAEKEAKEQQALDELLGNIPSTNTATTTQYNEGATATNPTTGQKLIFKGGKWQPM